MSPATTTPTASPPATSTTATGQLGWWDAAQPIGDDHHRLIGWARNPCGPGAASEVVIVAPGERIVARATVGEVRTDVANLHRDRSLTHCGWSVVMANDLLREAGDELLACVPDPDDGRLRALEGRPEFRLRTVTDEERQARADLAELLGHARTHCCADRRANARLSAEELAAGREILVSLPTWVTIELTSRCNLECTMCFRHGMGLAGEDIDPGLLERLEQSFFPRSSMISFDGSGEPLFYPGWDALVAELGRWDFTPQTLNLRELPELVDMAAGWGIRTFIIQSWNPHVPNQEIAPDREPALANAMYLEAAERALGHGMMVQTPALYPIEGDEEARLQAIYERHAPHRASRRPGPTSTATSPSTPPSSSSAARCTRAATACRRWATSRCRTSTRSGTAGHGARSGAAW